MLQRLESVFKRKNLVHALTASADQQLDNQSVLARAQSVFKRSSLASTLVLNGNGNGQHESNDDGLNQMAIGEARRAQMAEMYTDEDKQRLLASRKKFNRNISLAATSLGLATVGWFYWPANLIVLPILIEGSIPIYRKAYKMYKEGKVGVESLVAFTIAGSLASGFFWIGSFAVLMRQLSQRFLSSVTEESRSKLVDIFRQYPNSVWILSDGVEVEIPFEAVKKGQTVVVNAGETIPVDGKIIEGMATVDQHILTGESKPAEKETDDEVFALTIVLSGRILVNVEKAGDETTVAQIGQILNDTIEYKATAQLRSEELADRTVFPTLMIAGVALPVLGPVGALAVINSHFKYKMSAVAPLSLMNFLNIASQNGILVKDGRTLDLLNQIDTVVFDKTGTLTVEQPHVGTIHTTAEYDERTVLRYTAAAEQKQAHPIAKAIMEKAEQFNLDLPPIDEAEYKIGYGLTVTIEGKLIHVGSLRFMNVVGLPIPPVIQQAQEECHSLGHSLIIVAIDNEVVGGLEMLPTVRPEALDVIAELRKRGIKETYIISGDHEAPTRKLAHDLGIDHYFAETLPEDKANLIGKLQDEGRFVCYIGDGINDSIALKKSHVSVSLRGASTIAVDTAQIILMDGDLRKLVSIFDFAKEFEDNTNTTMAIVVLPTVIGIGGAFLFHFGLVHTILLNLMGLAGGIANGMRPMLKYQSKTKAIEVQ